MPAPIVGAAAAAAARLVAKKLASNAAKKAVKKTATKGRSRQAGDFAVSSKRNTPAKNMGKDSARISQDVTIKNATSPSGKVSLGKGGAQVFNQNTRLMLKTSKSEAKANARGLKAANKPTKAGKVMKKTMNPRKMKDVPSGVSSRFAETNARLAKEAAKKKSK
jgi:hypothetical protein